MATELEELVEFLNDRRPEVGHSALRTCLLKVGAPAVLISVLECTMLIAMLQQPPAVRRGAGCMAACH